MFPNYGFYSNLQFVVFLATPLVIAVIFIVAARSMARTLLILSLISLGLIALNAVLFGYAVFAGLYGRPNDETLLGILETGRVFLLGVVGLPTLAVWILALYDTARTRRWAWLAAVLLMGLLDYGTGGLGRNFGMSFNFNGWILYEELVSRHGVPLNLVFTALTHAAAVVPLVYALRYRNDTGTQSGSEAAPGASPMAGPVSPPTPTPPDA